MGFEEEQGSTRNESMTIGTTASIVSQKRNVRVKEFVYRNTSAAGQIISLFFSNQQQATANAGIVLAAGQSVSDTEYGGHFPWAGSITAISSAAGAVLSVYERS